ncbi:MAG: hypothetical protein LBS46_00575 [Dysgonamonadaceae bacterium]|jgi:hypothetical protein|nr:hypothetical protein [Dysgonamonadaceae bacterium]
MDIIKTVWIISCFSLLTGCGEKLMTYDVTTGTPIVESYLQEGSNTLSVQLYSMEVYLKDGYELSLPIEGVEPTINGKALTETVPGTYTLDLGTDTIRQQQNYELRFEYQGKTISASTSVPKPISGFGVEPAYITRSSSSYFWDTADTTEIKLTWDDAGESYYQLYIESPATSDRPSIDGSTQFRRRMMQPFRGNSYTTVSREFMSAGYYWLYIYRVNKDYVDLYERISSTDLANPASAINNAFGIFTAMSVAKIRFQVIETEE